MAQLHYEEDHNLPVGLSMAKCAIQHLWKDSYLILIFIQKLIIWSLWISNDY